MEMTLYYKRECPYCQKVLDHLKKLGKDIPKKDINQEPGTKDELIKMSGKSQVPCLMIDQKPLFESDAIITFLSKNINHLP